MPERIEIEPGRWVDTKTLDWFPLPAEPGVVAALVRLSDETVIATGKEFILVRCSAWPVN